VSPERPALAVICPSIEDGGAERYLRVIAGGAARQGWRVHVGLAPLQATARLLADLRAAGVRCHALRLRGPEPRNRRSALSDAAADAFTTLRMLRRVRPTTVLTTLSHPDQAPGCVLGAALYPARSVTCVQLVPQNLQFTPDRRHLYTLTRRLGQRWLTLSADNRRRLSDALGWRGAAISLIHNGVPAGALPEAGDRAQVLGELRDELRLPEDARLLLTVGRLNRQKAHDVIAASIPGVVSARGDAWWLWAGEGPARAELEDQLERQGVRSRVKLLGLRDDVPRLLQACDLLLVPSRYEGAPFALLEALAAQLPVIVSDAGPLPEIVRDGIEGRVVPVDDARALGAMTSWALEHPKQMRELAAAGRARVLRDFSRDGMVSQTLALLWPA
jgi:glycosyltransferase involved in cell wall biosynthesis